MGARYLDHGLGWITHIDNDNLSQVHAKRRNVVCVCVWASHGYAYCKQKVRRVPRRFQATRRRGTLSVVSRRMVECSRFLCPCGWLTGKKKQHRIYLKSNMRKDPSAPTEANRSGLCENEMSNTSRSCAISCVTGCAFSMSLHAEFSLINKTNQGGRPSIIPNRACRVDARRPDQVVVDGIPVERGQWSSRLGVLCGLEKQFSRFIPNSKGRTFVSTARCFPVEPSHSRKWSPVVAMVPADFGKTRERQQSAMITENYLAVGRRPLDLGRGERVVKLGLLHGLAAAAVGQAHNLDLICLCFFPSFNLGCDFPRLHTLLLYVSRKLPTARRTVPCG